MVPKVLPGVLAQWLLAVGLKPRGSKYPYITYIPPKRLHAEHGKAKVYHIKMWILEPFRKVGTDEGRRSSGLSGSKFAAHVEFVLMSYPGGVHWEMFHKVGLLI